MPDLWLEKELARQLAPVAAPESLWDRINREPRGEPWKLPRRIVPEWAFWTVAVAMGLLAVAGIVRTVRVNRDRDPMTEQELAVIGNRHGFDFHSKSFEDTRAWVKAASNIDIALPSNPAVEHPDKIAGAVSVQGARLVRMSGMPVAVVDYRVGDDPATLFVSAKQTGATGNAEDSMHLFSRIKTAGDMRFYSWSMRKQTYTIAFSGAKNPRGACLLCHSSTPS